MTVSDLSALIQTGESETCRVQAICRRDTGDCGDDLRFCQPQGGTILIGVTNAGEGLGLALGKDTLESLANRIQPQTDPKVFPALTTADVEHKTMEVVRVDESPLKPVLVQGRGFKRVGRSNHVLSSTEVAQLSLVSQGLSWDAGSAEGYRLSDLDLAAVRRFLVAAERERHLDINPDMPFDEALEKLDLRRDGQLTRAALLLLGQEPQRFLRQSDVRIARFRGTEPLHFLDMKVIEDTLIKQRTAILEFIQRHISMAADVKGWECEERWSIRWKRYGKRCPTPSVTASIATPATCRCASLMTVWRCGIQACCCRTPPGPRAHHEPGICGAHACGSPDRHT